MSNDFDLTADDGVPDYIKEQNEPPEGEYTIRIRGEDEEDADVNPQTGEIWFVTQ